MKLALLTAALAFALPMTVQAGTCAAPTPLFSNTDSSMSTCGGEIGIPLNGASYGHPSQVYSFTRNSAGPDGASGNIRIIGANIEAVITAGCNSSPVQGGAAGLDMSIDTLADGNWLLVVSTDPGLPVTNPPTCGDFTISPDTLPVSLQEFSID